LAPSAVIRRVPGELEIGEPDALIHDLIGVNEGGSLKTNCARRGDEIILIDAAAANA
jgi:hypothetical protein